MQTDVIPKGPYCYEFVDGEYRRCPYWNYVDRAVAYCAFLDQSDADGKGLGMLWDQLKECDINDE